MIFDNKTIKFMTKLIRLTSDNQLVWSLQNAPSSITEGTNSIIPLYFETVFKEKNLAIYSLRYQDFNPENESMYWSEKIVFVVLDFQNRVVWEMNEHSPALLDLMNTIREKESGINDLLDDMLDYKDEIF
jgi:hypothetical protein